MTTGPVDVLLEGRVVGVLTDPRFEDMFWFSYAVEVRDPAVLDDDAWEACAFTFRDRDGRSCGGAMVGGARPYLGDGRVMLRGLAFD